MKEYVFADEVPEADYLTPQRRYLLERYDDKLGIITDDDGDEVAVLLPYCPHLSGGAWSVERVEDD